MVFVWLQRKAKRGKAAWINIFILYVFARIWTTINANLPSSKCIELRAVLTLYMPGVYFNICWPYFLRPERWQKQQWLSAAAAWLFKNSQCDAWFMRPLIDFEEIGFSISFSVNTVSFAFFRIKITSGTHITHTNPKTPSKRSNWKFVR